MPRQLIAELRYGTCNRFRAYVCCKILAELNNRELIIIWNPEKGHMPVRLEDISTLEVKTIEKMPKMYVYNFIYYPFSDYKKFVRDLKSKKPIVACNTMLDLTPKVFIPRFASNMRRIRDSFVPGIMEQVHRIQDSIALRPDERLVTIHWRGWSSSLGDIYIQAILKGKNASHEKTVEELLDKINMAITEHPGTKFYLATDTPEILEIIKSFPNMKGRIFSNIKDSRDITRHNVEDIHNAMVDWYMLTLGDYIICSVGSSFSETASVLTREQRRENIGTNPWE